MNDFLQLIKKLELLRKYIFLLILRSPFDAVRTWMLAGLMKSFFDCVEEGNSEKLLSLGVFYGLICTLLFLYNGIVWSAYAAFAAKAEALIQKKVIQKILALPLQRVDSTYNAEWLTKVNADIKTAIAIMNAPINVPHLAVASINTLVASLLLVEHNLLIFFCVCVFTLPHLFINYRIVLKKVPDLKKESLHAMSENTASIEPLITNADAILLYEAEDLLLEKCEESSRSLMKINMQIHVRNAVSDALRRLFGSYGYMAILMIGCILIAKGTMMFSDLAYNLQIRNSLLVAMTMLIDSWNNVRTNSVSVKNLNEMLDE